MQHPAMMPKPSGSKRGKRSTCDLTEEPSCCAVLTDPVSDHSIVQMDVSLQETQMISLTKWLESQREDITGPTLYMYIVEGDSEWVNLQHEVRQIELASRMETTLLDTAILCSDIFHPLPGTEIPIRTVLTKGIAGIGKTFSVYKFTLDWARRMTNQHIDLLIPISFREMNLVRDKQYSLLTLIHDFHPALKRLTAEQLAACKTVFIFDGLDESRFSLNFLNNDIVSDITVTSSVDALLANLIKGNLFPSAQLWITTRPAATNQIPPLCLDRLTEVRGFRDPQKEEYFRKRFSGDEKMASRIISHINTSMTLHIMCYIPQFCWTTATVLENMLKRTGQLPKTLTKMFCHFLVQTMRKKLKYADGDEVNQQQLMETDWEVLLKLGRLAFEHLEKGMFYQEDLEGCDIDVKEVSYSGLCTVIFKRESVLFQRTVYSFVHLTIQEILAAVYLFHCFTQKNMEVLKIFLGEDEYGTMSLDEFLIKAKLKDLKSKNGHLVLLVRFLHGLSLESNQRLLGGLLGQTENSPEIRQRAINCLIEMQGDSIQEEMQQFLVSDNRSEKELSEPSRHKSHSMEGRLSSDKADHHQSNWDITTSSQSVQREQINNKHGFKVCGWFYQDSICPHFDIAPETDAGPSQSKALTTEGAGMLLSVREGFIAGVSNPVLDGLLDRLLTLKVLNDEEKDFISAEKTKRGKARQLIDIVRAKGDKASSKMISALKELDPYLHEELFDKA